MIFQLKPPFLRDFIGFHVSSHPRRCGITVNGPLSAGAAGGVSGVAKPLGMKSPGGGVRPTEVEPKEPAK
jgi:hypothetical protein